GVNRSRRLGEWPAPRQGGALQPPSRRQTLERIRPHSISAVCASSNPRAFRQGSGATTEVASNPVKTLKKAYITEWMPRALQRRQPRGGRAKSAIIQVARSSATLAIASTTAASVGAAKQSRKKCVATRSTDSIRPRIPSGRREHSHCTRDCSSGGTRRRGRARMAGLGATQRERGEGRERE